MKDIISKINESHQIEFRVAFNDAKDKNGKPFTVSILVDEDHEDEFRKYLEKEKDNSIFMAEDIEGNPIGEN